MSGQFLGHFRLYLIDSTAVISSKVAKFGSMDIVGLHGDILQLETPHLFLTQEYVLGLNAPILGLRTRSPTYS